MLTLIQLDWALVRSVSAYPINKSKPFERLRTSQNLTLEMLDWALFHSLHAAYTAPERPKHAPLQSDISRQANDNEAALECTGPLRL
jgi:hypothetical protein